MAGDRRRPAARRLDVELRHAGVGAAPGRRPTSGRDPPAYTASSGAPIMRSHARTDVATNTASTATGTAPARRAAGAGPSPASNARTNAASKTRARQRGRDPASPPRARPRARQARCRRLPRSRAGGTGGPPAARPRAPTPIAVATSGRGRPSASQHDEYDQPERDDVEEIPVVEPVVSVRQARERSGDEEKPRG